MIRTALLPLIVVAAPHAARAESLMRIGEETVIGVTVDDQGITFQVPTGGCTAKENFGLETVSPEPLTLRLLRLRPDYCQASIPGGVKIHFTYAEIGLGAHLPAARQKALVIVNVRQPTAAVATLTPKSLDIGAPSH